MQFLFSWFPNVYETPIEYHDLAYLSIPHPSMQVNTGASLFFTEPPCHENNLNNCKDNLSLARGLTRPRPLA